jgi:hypothetical protein
MSSRPCPSTWSVCKGKKKREGEKHGIRSSWPKFEFEFEFFKLGLEIEQG